MSVFFLHRGRGGGGGGGGTTLSFRIPYISYRCTYSGFSLLFLITAHKTFPFLAIEIQLLGIMDSALMLNTLFMGQISRKEYRIHYRTTSNKLFFSGNVVYPKGFKPTLPPPSTPFSGHSLKCELLLQNNVHTCIQYIFFFL